MIVTINNKEFQFTLNWGSIYLFEELADKTWKLETNREQNLSLYCVLKFNNEDFAMTTSEFDDLIEDYDVRNALLNALYQELELKMSPKKGQKETTSKTSKKKK